MGKRGRLSLKAGAAALASALLTTAALQKSQSKPKPAPTQPTPAPAGPRASTSKSAKGKGKAAPTPTEPLPIRGRILLIGEANFAFARSLAEHHLDDLDRARLVATTLDSVEITTRKYPDAAENAARVVELGGTVIHGVDATSLESCKALRGMTWDSIVFNYPHLGSGEKDQDRNGALARADLALTGSLSASDHAPALLPLGRTLPHSFVEQRSEAAKTSTARRTGFGR